MDTEQERTQGVLGGDSQPRGFSHLPEAPVIPQGNGFPQGRSFFLLSSSFPPNLRHKTHFSLQQALPQYSQEMLPSWDTEALKVGGRMVERNLWKTGPIRIYRIQV